MNAMAQRFPRCWNLLTVEKSRVSIGEWEALRMFLKVNADSEVDRLLAAGDYAAAVGIAATVATMCIEDLSERRTDAGAGGEGDPANRTEIHDGP